MMDIELMDGVSESPIQPKAVRAILSLQEYNRILFKGFFDWFKRKVIEYENQVRIGETKYSLKLSPNYAIHGIFIIQR